jgi:hypothetical protein
MTGLTNIDFSNSLVQLFQNVGAWMDGTVSPTALALIDVTAVPECAELHRCEDEAVLWTESGPLDRSESRRINMTALPWN